MIKYDTNRMTCSEDEKKELLIYIEQLLEWKVNYEKQGAFFFQEFIHHNGDILENISIWLILQGYNPDLSVEILSNLLSISCDSGLKYVKHILFFETVLFIQAGNTSEGELKLYLLSFLDEKLLYEYIKSLRSVE